MLTCHTVAAVEVKTQPLVHLTLQNTCNHQNNTNTKEAETTANQIREQNKAQEEKRTMLWHSLGFKEIHLSCFD